MKTIFATFALCCSVAVADTAGSVHPTSSEARVASEVEPVVQAARLVQPALLDGPGYRVVPEVPVRGYMAHFLIDTRFGPIAADSAEMLSIRVGEIPALEALDRASRSEAFGHALIERGRKTGEAVMHVVAHPIDTIVGIPQGVVRYVAKQIDTWSNRGQSLSDRSARVFENKGDPYRAAAGPMSAGRQAGKDDAGPVEEKKSRAWYARLGSETGREAKRYLKYGEQRREISQHLNVDPNSTNPLLNAKLDDLAWAAVSGNFSAGTAIGAVGGTGAVVIADTGQLNKIVWQLDTEQLREVNRTRLAKFCSDDFGVRQFLRRGGFNDSLRTSLIDTLEKLNPQTGCDALAELATTTSGEIEARYLVNALQLIEHEADTRSGSLSVVGAAVVWRTHKNRLLLPLPVDYLSWSHGIAEFFDQKEFRSSDKTVLIGGEISMLAQQQLTDRGWNLIVRAPRGGAPIYADGAFSPAHQ